MIMPEGIEQYIKKLAQEAYADLEKGNRHEARQRVILIINATKHKWFKKEYENKEINDLAKQILKLLKEVNFRKAEELLTEIYKKLLSEEESKKRGISSESYNTVQGLSSLGYLCIHDVAPNIYLLKEPRQDKKEKRKKEIKEIFNNLILCLKNQGSRNFQLPCSLMHPQLNLRPIGYIFGGGIGIVLESGYIYEAYKEDAGTQMKGKGESKFRTSPREYRMERLPVKNVLEVGKGDTWYNEFLVRMFTVEGLFYTKGTIPRIIEQLKQIAEEYSYKEDINPEWINRTEKYGVPQYKTRVYPIYEIDSVDIKWKIVYIPKRLDMAAAA